MNQKSYLISLLAALALSACSSGGSDGPPPPPPPPTNVAPTVDAGDEQLVPEFSSVELVGMASDSDGTIASYVWTQLSGTNVTLTNANTQTVSFNAPSTEAELIINLEFRLTVTDNDGATSSDTVVVMVETTNTPPEVDAGIEQSVDEQSLVSLTATAADPDGGVLTYAWSQLGGTSVTLNSSDSAITTFTAPSISATETLNFEVIVTDDRGEFVMDDVNVIVNPVTGLNDAPTANAGEDLTTSSDQSVRLDASASVDSDGSIASYAWVQTSGATVTLSNANAVIASFSAPTVTANTNLGFDVTVTDNEGATATDSILVTVTPQPTVVSVAGTATYDNVPHTVGNGLNYAVATQDPIRGAVVELRQGNTTLQTSATDNDGNYSFDVDPNTTGLQIRISSQSVSTATAQWNVMVVDNTNLGSDNQQAIYSIVGSIFDVATTNISRPNLNASSGWGGNSYTGPRAAAPFHILDRIYDGILKLVEVDADIIMPVVDVNWSPANNLTSTGLTLANLRSGNVGTSFSVRLPASFSEFEGPQLFILGAENSDTDEYDGHVVIHEWGHYFEGNLSRSDSIGGAHTGNDRLDMRVAFGEGFGNAWSGIMTDDSFYRDSFGSQQGQGFSINVENNNVNNRGWYNEASVQSILYDIYDSTNDGSDTISLGLKPIYDVLVGQQRTTDAFTSIFSFSEYFREGNGSNVAAYNSILVAQDVNGTDRWGNGETNDANENPSSNVLPVYTQLTVDGPAQEVCSIDDFDSSGQTAESGNKLSNFRFIRFNIATAGSYAFLVSATATQDPDMPIYQQGNQIFFAVPGGDGDAGDTSDSSTTLQPGTYSAELYEFDNTSRGNTGNSSDECFTVQLVAN